MRIARLACLVSAVLVLVGACASPVNLAPPANSDSSAAALPDGSTISGQAAASAPTLTVRVAQAQPAGWDKPEYIPAGQAQMEVGGLVISSRVAPKSYWRYHLNLVIAGGGNNKPDDVGFTWEVLDGGSYQALPGLFRSIFNSRLDNPYIFV